MPGICFRSSQFWGTYQDMKKNNLTAMLKQTFYVH